MLNMTGVLLTTLTRDRPVITRAGLLSRCVSLSNVSDTDAGEGDESTYVKPGSQLYPTVSRQ